MGVSGSAGAKAMAVVSGKVDAYVHAGGQYEWDSCAPVGVARAAGLHCSRLDGSELTYNNPDPYLPDLVVCRPELAEKVRLYAAEPERARDKAEAERQAAKALSESLVGQQKAAELEVRKESRKLQEQRAAAESHRESDHPRSDGQAGPESGKQCG